MTKLKVDSVVLTFCHTIISKLKRYRNTTLKDLYYFVHSELFLLLLSGLCIFVWHTHMHCTFQEPLSNKHQKACFQCCEHLTADKTGKTFALPRQPSSTTVNIFPLIRDTDNPSWRYLAWLLGCLFVWPNSWKKSQLMFTCLTLSNMQKRRIHLPVWKNSFFLDSGMLKR